MTRTTVRARFALLGAIAITLSACSSSASPGASSGTGAAKVEIFSWWTAGGEATGLNRLIDQFNSKNPQWQVVNQAVAGGAGSNAKAVLKTRVLDNKPPDLFQSHMGHELTDTWLQYIEPLDDLYAKNSWNDKFPKGVMDIISDGGHIWAVPVNIHRANVLWYNKKVFSANGIKPPTTWDEFRTVADKLRGKGIIPLALGGKDNFEAGQVLETILIGTLGADKYKGLWTGTTNWAGADVTKALSTFKTVLGYVNPDHSALTWDQANDLVISGKAAMTIMGDWVDGYNASKNFTDYGWALAPGNKDIYDALSDVFALPKGAKNADAAKSFLTLLGSPEGQDIFNPNKGSVPARLDAGKPAADQKQYDDYLKSAQADWKADTIVPSLEHGAAAKPSWATAYNQAVTLFMTSGNVAAAQTALVKACKDAGICK